MKRIFLIIILALGLINSFPSSGRVGGIRYTPITFGTVRNLSRVVLGNGIYQVPIYYESHTGQKSTYTLNVKIMNDNVVCIYFDDGGYLHNGSNSSGYKWRGGGIQWNIDWHGNITGGRAEIMVQYPGNQYQLFTVRL